MRLFEIPYYIRVAAAVIGPPGHGRLVVIILTRGVRTSVRTSVTKTRSALTQNLWYNKNTLRRCMGPGGSLNSRN